MSKTQRPAVRAIVAAVLAVFLAVAAVGCGGAQQSETTGGGQAEKQSQLILATTTSTQDTGLLDELIPAFNKKYPQYQVKTIAVGSGEAIAMGAKGDADVLLVHSKDDEEKFMKDGNGTERLAVMFNDFVLVGPKTDPAKVKGMDSGPDAFKKIADAKATFINRGDESGTDKKEIKIWKAAGVDPKGQPWYVVTGQGMGETLRIADQKNGYTLADRGTWLATAKSLPNLELLVEGGKDLKNNYHVIVVSKTKFPKINEAGAKAFAAYLVSPGGQAAIKEFGIKKFGQSLFTPDAGSK